MTFELGDKLLLNGILPIKQGLAGVAVCYNASIQCDKLKHVQLDGGISNLSKLLWLNFLPQGLKGTEAEQKLQIYCSWVFSKLLLPIV